MRWMRTLVLVGAGVGVTLAASAARAQQQGGCTFTDESGKTVFWPNCEDPAEKKGPDGATPQGGQRPGTTPGQAPSTAGGSANPAKSFPFPGDGEAPIVRQTAPAGQSGGAGSSGAGSSGAGSSGAGSSAPAASKFPFPGEDSGGGNGPLRDAGSSGNSSSSSSSSSSSGPPERDPTAGPLGDDDPDTDSAAKAAEARRAARAKRGIEFHQTSDQREAEDLRVAAFYHDDGNFKGMYERAADAVSLADDDADAHFALAEAARHLGKLDEAETHYKKCLTLDPVPKTRKAAEKALKEMTSGG